MNNGFNISILLELIIKLVIIVLIVTIVFEIAKTSFILYKDRRVRSKLVVLKILPKSDIESKEIEKLLKNLHSMLLNTKFRKYFYGRQYMSYEISAVKGHINFYLCVPGDLKDRIVDRIYAAYPDIAIESVDDYIPDLKDGDKGLSVYTAQLKLAYHHTLKIKTADLIGSIASGLRDLDNKDFVSVQILMRPLDNKWQIRGRRDLEEFERKGIKPGEKKSKSEEIADKLQKTALDVVDELAGGKAGKYINFNVNSGKGGKTKLERKEIVVASEKVNDVGFDVVLRIVAAGKFKKGNTARITALVAAFSELNAENKFKRERIVSHSYIYNRFKERKMAFKDSDNILTPTELSSFVLRLPGVNLAKDYEEIDKVAIREFKAPKEAYATGKGIIIGSNRYRSTENLIEIKPKDLTRHLVIQGKTGTGKSEWAKTVFIDHISDKYDESGKLIRKGLGGMILEPHGKLANEMIELIPEYRRKDVIVFDLFSDHPLGFNFCKVNKVEGSELTLEQQEQKTLEEALEIFKRNFEDVWSSKNEYYIENAIRAIMDAGLTMLELPRMFTDDAFREKVIPLIKDVETRKFWIDKFKRNKQGNLNPQVESTAQSVEYKIKKFLRSKELRRSLGQNECVDFKDILDNNKIIIFKFNKDKMTNDAVNFIGGIAIKLVIVAAFARIKERWDDPFVILIDEAQNFVSESIKDVLYELRKYGISLMLMHQELEQMNKVPGLLNAIYNMVGSKITFATGEKDAPFISKVYSPKVDEEDVKSLPSRNGYCKILVNGATTETFNLYSIDSPQVTAEVAAESKKEIEAYNAEGRMSAEELDEMIAARYADEEDEEFDYTEDDFKVSIPEYEKIEDSGVEQKEVVTEDKEYEFEFENDFKIDIENGTVEKEDFENEEKVPEDSQEENLKSKSCENPSQQDITEDKKYEFEFEDDFATNIEDEIW